MRITLKCFVISIFTISRGYYIINNLTITRFIAVIFIYRNTQFTITTRDVTILIKLLYLSLKLRFLTS
ncbi:Uncharacterised protein [Vibrio cholerae]|nr:Uncharacterised protein [Vibrio cholerae]